MIIIFITIIAFMFTSYCIILTLYLHLNMHLCSYLHTSYWEYSSEFKIVYLYLNLDFQYELDLIRFI